MHLKDIKLRTEPNNIEKIFVSFGLQVEDWKELLVFFRKVQDPTEKQSKEIIDLLEQQLNDPSKIEVTNLLTLALEVRPMFINEQLPEVLKKRKEKSIEWLTSDTPQKVDLAKWTSESSEDKDLREELAAYVVKRLQQLQTQHTRVIDDYEKRVEKCMENLGGAVNLKEIAYARNMDLLQILGGRDELKKIKTFLEKGEEEE